MISLRNTAVGIAAAALLAPVALLGPASSASAQTVPNCDLRPRGTTFASTAKTLDFAVPSATTWSYELPGIGLSVDSDDSTVKVDPKKLKNSDARAQVGTVERTRRSDGVEDTCNATWRLKRATRLTGVKVTKIKYGRKITGKLERVNWGKSPKKRWNAYAGDTIRVSFVNARGQWQDAGTVDAAKDGSFKFTKQIGKRKWRLYFQGDNSSGVTPYITITG
ncbi:hypothetical protein KIH74_27550 [Kineosporia sp. J2-2]|uniref:Secreted protein n=1 Tax=Kineosporia corallincola TaxID=2835133 RepID=A0ABS5TNQ5_9ACTN|nr:hypothetical protein [Kineosporia corallincola]MBT0772731.1 hypothetical protein [Kineosporia corallincola]